MPEGFTQPEPQYGDATRMGELTRAAPISGAPMPGAGAPAAPAPAAPSAGPAIPGAGMLPVLPQAGPDTLRIDYYIAVARTWAKLAKAPNASPSVKEMAARAREYAAKVKRGLL